MKRTIVILSLLLAASVSVFAATPVRKDTLKVLAIGNSFSQDAVEQNLHEIAESYGKLVLIGNMYIGGCSLERHYNNALSFNTDYAYRKLGAKGIKRESRGYTLGKALLDEEWDIITLQQCSGQSGLMETYEPYLTGLVAFIQALCPKAEIVWHQTWAYAVDSDHPEFPAYDRDQMKMYEAIMTASSKVCESYDFRVIPCGTAIQNLRATADGDNCTRDGYHLNDVIGRYVAALTWYEVLFGGSVEGCSYLTEGLTPERAALAHQSVDLAVEKPFEVSVK